MSSKLDAVPCVDIDANGRFKYILVKINYKTHQKYIVRGYTRAAYHGLTMSSKLDAVPCVDIDASGRFKYILVKINYKTHQKYIVRGYTRAAYHADIYDEILPGIEALGLKADCLGGGRIEHNEDEKSILVYGYSMGFGHADHSITTDILKKFFPTYSKITFSNEGY